MNDQPNRKWLQIHLSTAVLLMFVAAGLLWVNLHVVRTHRTFFQSGVPLMDTGVDDIGIIGNLSLHTPLTLPLNVALNVAFLVGVAAVSERLIWGKRGHTGELVGIMAQFRLHRSTKLALLLSLGAIILLNAVSLSFEYWSMSGHYGGAYYGWPYPNGLYSEFYCTKSGSHLSPFVKVHELSGLSWNPFLYSPLVIDLVVWLCILCTVGFFCEWLIRRRAAKP